MCVGLLTTEDGFPLRIQAFSGNTPDSTTVAGQIRALRDELGVEEIVLVGDRGMHIVYNLAGGVAMITIFLFIFIP